MCGDCENCARPSGDVRPVHRVYLVPEPAALASVEWWCGGCRSQYPHEEAGSARPAD